MRPEGDRLVVIGHPKDNGETVELGRLEAVGAIWLDVSLLDWYRS